MRGVVGPHAQDGPDSGWVGQARRHEVHGMRFQLPILLSDLRQDHAVSLALTQQTASGPLLETQARSHLQSPRALQLPLPAVDPV